MPLHATRLPPPAALATAGHRPDDAALSAAAAAAERLLPASMPPSSLAWLLWSFAHFRHQPPRSLLRKAERALRGPQLLALYAAEPAHLARLCWALAELGYYSGAPCCPLHPPCPALCCVCGALAGETEALAAGAPAGCYLENLWMAD